MKTLAIASAAVALATLGASAASAAVVFNSTFEGAAVNSGHYITVNSIDGWTSSTYGIEVQNHIAGSPAATGGNKFVELDTNRNSSMSRNIGAGTFDLSFLYSPRPGVASNSNGIEVWIGQTLLGSYSGVGGGDTNWSTKNIHFATAGGPLTFVATGRSDSLGGYLDNIKLVSGVPEPSTWAMMITGFGLMGVTLRRRRLVPAHA
ncbi:MAG TPA: PEPxxWA-CTERM sorting domain-containing protein [Phenylobacterium sp.]|nr:PEPxxWA-CTERM sorting domain-containing protein [Phenylobacterium sp.]